MERSEVRRSTIILHFIRLIICWFDIYVKNGSVSHVSLMSILEKHSKIIKVNLFFPRGFSWYQNCKQKIQQLGRIYNSLPECSAKFTSFEAAQSWKLGWDRIFAPGTRPFQSSPFKSQQEAPIPVQELILYPSADFQLIRTRKRWILSIGGIMAH